MNVLLSPDLEKLIEEKVSSGLYSSANDMIREALSLLQEREQNRQMKLDELRKEIQIGIQQADRGDLVDGEVVFNQLRLRNHQFSSSNHE